MKNKVSIIVPIYNAFDYIQICVDSLIKQTYQNLEIILLNDGSTDNTDSKLKKIKDKRIKYVNKSNTGVGDTRNLGIAMATGDYLMFVDSDDYLELDTVEKLVNKAISDKCDLVVMDMMLEIKKPTPLLIPHFEDTNLKETPELLTTINLGPCNKLYHKDLFKDKNNRFMVGLKYEDAPVVVQVLRDAKKIGHIPEALYHYVIKNTGETINRDERVLDIIKICKVINNKLEGYTYLSKTDLMVKILSPYLKNSRFILDKNIRNKLIDEVYNYLKLIDKKWRSCNYLKNNEAYLKRIIITHKFLLKLYVCISNLK